MLKFKPIALVLTLFVMISGLLTADHIIQKDPRYYDFAVLFKNAWYSGKDEEIPERDVGEPLEDAANYRATRYKNKWCDCMERIEKDTASAYRDAESEDDSSIIVLTDTGTYIRAHFYRMADYDSAPDLDFGMVRDLFLLDDKKLEKVWIYDINREAWDGFISEEEDIKRWERLLSIPYPRVKELDGVSDTSDFYKEITLFYAAGEQHTIGLDFSKRRLYAYEAQFWISEEEYREWLEALRFHEGRL